MSNTPMRLLRRLFHRHQVVFAWWAAPGRRVEECPCGMTRVNGGHWEQR